MSKASIEIPFAVGAEVWHATMDSYEKWEVCPDCCGSKALTMTQGNGMSFDISCATCSVGYDPPYGKIRSRCAEYAPVLVTLGEVTLDDGKAKYRIGECRVIQEDRLFADRDKCQAECDKLSAEHAANIERQNLANLASKRRDMAWSVHYWQRERTRLRKDLERIDQRLRECKARKP